MYVACLHNVEGLSPLADTGFICQRTPSIAGRRTVAAAPPLGTAVP